MIYFFRLAAKNIFLFTVRGIYKQSLPLLFMKGIVEIEAISGSATWWAAKGKKKSNFQIIFNMLYRTIPL